MPAKYTLHVALTENLRSFVADQVASGRFGTASEMVRASLRLLERDLVPSQPAGPAGSAEGEP